jgi:hypothetical protein
MWLFKKKPEPKIEPKLEPKMVIRTYKIKKRKVRLTATDGVVEYKDIDDSLEYSYPYPMYYKGQPTNFDRWCHDDGLEEFIRNNDLNHANLTASDGTVYLDRKVDKIEIVEEKEEIVTKEVYENKGE